MSEQPKGRPDCECCKGSGIFIGVKRCYCVPAKPCPECAALRKERDEMVAADHCPGCGWKERAEAAEADVLRLQAQVRVAWDNGWNVRDTSSVAERLADRDVQRAAFLATPAPGGAPSPAPAEPAPVAGDKCPTCGASLIGKPAMCGTHGPPSPAGAPFVETRWWCGCLWRNGRRIEWCGRCAEPAEAPAQDCHEQESETTHAPEAPASEAATGEATASPEGRTNGERSQQEATKLARIDWQNRLMEGLSRQPGRMQFAPNGEAFNHEPHALSRVAPPAPSAEADRQLAVETLEALGVPPHVGTIGVILAALQRSREGAQT